jgi:hypothetical protein
VTPRAAPPRRAGEATGSVAEAGDAAADALAPEHQQDRDRSGGEESTAAIHFGSDARSPGSGRPRHCFAPIPRKRAPRRSLITSTAVEEPESGSSAPLATRSGHDTDDDEADAITRGG